LEVIKYLSPGYWQSKAFRQNPITFSFEYSVEIYMPFELVFSSWSSACFQPQDIYLAVVLRDVPLDIPV